jgi:hypothetical protein
MSEAQTGISSEKLIFRPVIWADAGIFSNIEILKFKRAEFKKFA